jgi:1-acyl-sn-glycerol-3-phosphate acyltransferase
MKKREDFFNKVIDSRPIKGFVYAIIGFISYSGINLISKLKINGMDRLRKLPKQNVIFVSNHHTYFADVITMMHVFCAASWGRKKTLGFPIYLLWPFIKVKYVAASTTMKRTFYPEYLLWQAQ